MQRSSGDFGKIVVTINVDRLDCYHDAWGSSHHVNV
jgi:hypothetical protein